MARKPEKHYKVKTDPFLNALWRKYDLCQVDLAEAAGITPEHLSAVLNDRRPLTYRVGMKLAKALGIPFKKLFKPSKDGKV